ncbi:hypothetical protein L6452_39477 [Arctium lappa]|uniref:Uncharacterized protein n=1 Tax=Arctium lappa TaxID=4217 RepID=A0ACB8XT00_ARCLA|nr:hypothetical protein L6452_39477 [Arctium lappa]
MVSSSCRDVISSDMNPSDVVAGWRVSSVSSVSFWLDMHQTQHFAGKSMEAVEVDLNREVRYMDVDVMKSHAFDGFTSKGEITRSN